ncbi:Zinc finger protein 681 [Acipenser ruthenus]|uniref:Zinc finger protein 681 n=1 Tax=Acipenser ruthenus TaxID=7906 RepID=A0A444V2I5_ACIRT|nr:Zinc finger protein 681 [Acipenser ruthenus]
MCGTFGLPFRHASELLYHEQAQHGRQPRASEAAGSGSNKNSSKRLSCTICLRFFQCASNLRDHYNVHTRERPYLCPYCAKGFTQPSSLATHKRLHTGERPYHCQRCAKSFRDASNAAKHRRVHERARDGGREAGGERGEGEELEERGGSRERERSWRRGRGAGGEGGAGRRGRERCWRRTERKTAHLT